MRVGFRQGGETLTQVVAAVSRKPKTTHGDNTEAAGNCLDIHVYVRCIDASLRKLEPSAADINNSLESDASSL